MRGRISEGFAQGLRRDARPASVRARIKARRPRRPIVSRATVSRPDELGAAAAARSRRPAKDGRGTIGRWRTGHLPRHCCWWELVRVPVRWGDDEAAGGPICGPMLRKRDGLLSGAIANGATSGCISSARSRRSTNREAHLGSLRQSARAKDSLCETLRQLRKAWQHSTTPRQ